MSRRPSFSALAVSAFLVALALFLAGRVRATPPPKPAIGDTDVLATIPAAPGFPEGIAVHGHTVYVSTAATFGTAGNNLPSKIYRFDVRDGSSLGTIDIVGEDMNHEHALSGMAFDGNGLLYVLSTQIGIVRLDPADPGQQTVYGTPLEDLPACGQTLPFPLPPGTPCSPTQLDAPPLPNDIAFDDAGYAYVTDSLQATIWRFPPGGGRPQIWFQDARLDVPGFGPNGVRLTPDRSHFVFAVTGNQTGTIYSLPHVDQPQAGDLATVHTYNAFEAPDDLAFGSSGNLYVSLALANQISVIAPDGSESRLPSQGSLIPYDGPANLAFDNRTASLLAVNHAPFSNTPAHFAVLRTFVQDHEGPLARP